MDTDKRKEDAVLTTGGEDTVFNIPVVELKPSEKAI